MKNETFNIMIVLLISWKMRLSISWNLTSWSFLVNVEVDVNVYGNVSINVNVIIQLIWTGPKSKSVLTYYGNRAFSFI